MPLEFIDDHIAREMGAATFDKGRDVWARDLVRRAEVSNDGTRISGSVTGTRRAPYSQTIALTRPNGNLRITGYCTCPMAFNCKHVAAVLIQVLDERREAAEAARSAGPGAADFDSPMRPEAVPVPVPAPPPSPLQAISREVTGWLDRIGKAASPAPAGAAPPKKPSQRILVYVLDPAPPPGQPASPGHLQLLTARVGRNGELHDAKAFDPQQMTWPVERRARYLDDADHGVLADLFRVRRLYVSVTAADFVLEADIGSERVLEQVLRTGRLRHRSIAGPVLREGPAIAAAPAWIKTADGHQRLRFVPTATDSSLRAPDAIENVLPMSPLRYVDAASSTLGVIDSGLPPALGREVAMAPAVSASEASLVKELMRLKLAGAHPKSSAAAPATTADATSRPLPLPLPDAPDAIETRSFVPIPRLLISLAPATLRQGHLWYLLPDDVRRQGALAIPIARLSFDYGGELVDLAAPTSMIERMEGDKLVLLPRDQKAELAAAERLRTLGFRLLARTPFRAVGDHEGDFFLYPSGSINDYELLSVFDAPERFIAFERAAVPSLRSQGWQVVHAEDYPYRLAEGDVEWWADAGDGSGIDWFSFELGIHFEGQRINLVPFLVGMLERLPPHVLALAHVPDGAPAFAEACTKISFYHTLADGRMLPLPGERMASMLKALLELIGPRGERLSTTGVRLHRAEAALLAGIADDFGADVAWAASSTRLIELGKSLRRGRGLERVEPPASFRAELRSYQSDGLAWIDFLRETGFGGVLADDMGLGKTVQALAFIAREKAAGRLDRPVLIVAPTSVLPNWQAETERFAPELRVLALRGLDRKAQFSAIPDHDVVLTTYPLLARDHETLLGQEFHAAILDEAQAIKNPKATVTGLAHRIKARHRFALTGTPLENNLGEVWSLFQFLSPGLLGDESTFRRTFRTPIEKHGDATAQAFLSRRLRPFMLRRTKAEVATELPPKTEIVERIQLEGAQRDLYETVRSLMHEKVREEIARKGLAKSHIVFLDALLKLRQICCDPRLLKLPQARKVHGSAKLERLMEMIPEMVAEGRRILLFSQFTSMLALIEAELTKLAIPYVQLTGQTTDRAVPVKAFQSGKVPLFLLSLKAGGTGLNLTAADTVIHYDPWWNPAVESQATDRAYRIGQDKPVFVYKMIVDEGIETAIEQLKLRKAALADALFAGASKAPLDLTEADISALFAPLEGAARGRERKPSRAA